MAQSPRLNSSTRTHEYIYIEYYWKMLRAIIKHNYSVRTDN